MEVFCLKTITKCLLLHLPGYHSRFVYFFVGLFDAQQAEKVIEEHDSSKPLFLYLPFQNVHFPVQAPQKYIDKYSFIHNQQRRTYAAMLDIVDEAIGNVTKSLQKRGYVVCFAINQSNFCSDNTLKMNLR